MMKPTGDPTCPSEVLQAKQVRDMIESRSDAVNCDSYDQSELGIIDSDDDDEDDEEEESTEADETPQNTPQQLKNIGRPLVNLSKKHPAKKTQKDKTKMKRKGLIADWLTCYLL